MHLQLQVLKAPLKLDLQKKILIVLTDFLTMDNDIEAFSRSN